jgi:hypothetical protein
MVRAATLMVGAERVVVIDHYVDTEAGVTGEEMVAETRRLGGMFASVAAQDTGGVLG